MNSILDKLTRIENRLQTLIEQGAARMLPNANGQSNITSGILAALKSSIKPDETGQLIAADLFILVVDQETALLISEEPSLVEEFNQLIVQAGTEYGVQFTRPPRIKISADASMEPGRFDVLAQFSMQKARDTSTLTVSAEEGKSIPEDAFLIINGAQIFPLTQQVVNLGRRLDNHVVIEDMSVSREHAQIRAIKGHYVIFDLDSSGGTFVNGVRMTQATLYPGDVISLAGVDLVYGQDAAYISGKDPGSTQPLIPFPKADD